MAYCTNCGQENSKKICSNCGVKQNTTHNYCEFCGNAINANAAICTNCNEKVKPGKGTFGTILGAILIFLGIAESSALLKVIGIVLGLSMLPFAKRMIRKMTVGKISQRRILSIAQTVLALILIVVMFNSESDVPHRLDEDDAIEAAEVVFHEQVELKNEASYVLNEADVDVDDEPYHGHEGWVQVTVVLDYSAENSFGGMVRDEYTVEIFYNYEDGEFYRAYDAAKIR